MLISDDTAEQLHACLDPDAWVTALSGANAGGALRKSSDLLIVEGHRLPPRTTAFHHDVNRHGDSRFHRRTDLVVSTAKFPGYVGTVLVPPAPEAGIDAWMSILIFRTDGQLAAWSTSDERGAPPLWLFAAVDWLDFWRH